MDFPQYRKLENDQAFYRIDSDREFVEIKLVGSLIQIHHIKADKYPELLRIREMLSMELSGILPCEKGEFEVLVSKAK